MSQLIAFEAAKAGQAFGFLQSLDDDPVIDDDVSTVSSVVVRYPFSGSAGVDPNVDAAVGVKAGPAVSAAVRRLPFAGVAERPSSLYSAGAVPGGFRTNFADKLGSAFNKLQRRVVAPPRTHDSPVSGSSSSGLGSLPFTASLDEPPSREGPEHRRAFSGMCRDSGQVRPPITMDRMSSLVPPVRLVAFQSPALRRTAVTRPPAAPCWPTLRPLGLCRYPSSTGFPCQESLSLLRRSLTGGLFPACPFSAVMRGSPDRMRGRLSLLFEAWASMLPSRPFRRVGVSRLQVGAC